MDAPKQALVVVTYKGSLWLQDCLDSLAECKYPVHICWSEEGAYDTEGLYYAQKHGLESFILLHDTMIVKDQSFLDVLADKGNTKIANQMFLAKFVAPYNLPEKPQTKAEAIDMETFWYTPKDWPLLCPELVDCDNWEVKNGRMNMVLENGFIRKYKGNWGQKQYV
jgi:hypothetical protein